MPIDWLAAPHLLFELGHRLVQSAIATDALLLPTGRSFLPSDEHLFAHSFVGSTIPSVEVAILPIALASFVLFVAGHLCPTSWFQCRDSDFLFEAQFLLIAQ
nr:MAG: hypothetical protein [Bacteriophage sp.]